MRMRITEGRRRPLIARKAESHDHPPLVLGGYEDPLVGCGGKAALAGVNRVNTGVAEQTGC